MENENLEDQICNDDEEGARELERKIIVEACMSEGVIIIDSGS